MRLIPLGPRLTIVFLERPTVSGNVNDQRENDRREREARRIATLPINEQQIAIDAELVLQDQYDNRAQSTCRETQRHVLC